LEASGKDMWILEDSLKYVGKVVYLCSKCIKYYWNCNCDLEMEVCPSKKRELCLF
jgi:hypothetical protein